MTDPKTIADPKVQEFIVSHEDTDLSVLLLSGKSVAAIPTSELVDQIRSRNKACKKLPQWYEATGIVYPPPLSLEQASSEETAAYKAEILASKGDRLLDLTGGMGIDSSYFARRFQAVTYVEQQEFLVSCFRHNCSRLGIDNCHIVAGDGVAYLKELPDDQYEVIYLDPARRDAEKKKVFALDQCEPDVSVIWEELLAKTPTVMVKLSPMLDITHTIASLQHVAEVHVVAVDNECKELLVLLERDFVGETIIRTINLHADQSQVFEFCRSEERDAVVGFGAEGKFLYEPNVAVLKAGAFKTMASRYQLAKMHEHTHLYLSDELIQDFPGRIYQVVRQFGASKKMIKANLKGMKVSIKSRNYPESVALLRKKYQLHDGDDRSVFFCTVKTAQQKEQKMVFECVKATIN